MTDNELRARQKSRNRVVLILLLLIAAIIFALTFQHMINEQKTPSPKATLAESEAIPRADIRLPKERKSRWT